MACERPTASRIPVSRVILLLLVFIAIIYGNTLDAAWHLDDYPNILFNTNVQIEELTPSALLKAIHMPYTSGERITRPLARLSMALNWYWHGDRLTGYHLVNIGIHVTASVLLYLTILTLLRSSPVLRDRYREGQPFIALFGTILWAINPVQIQAITYIVQRMASMGGMFYVLSLYLYLRGRTCDIEKQRWGWWLAAAAAFAAAMASKENTALLPFALVLMEITFFQDVSRPAVRRRWFWILGLVGIVFVIGTSLVFLQGDLSIILRHYEGRPFSLTERVLTQPRVIWLYISLLLYPIPSRLTPEHDIVYSTSLMQPWTTMPAIVGLVLLAVLGVWLLRRRPLVSFAILFFLLNHAIESSFLALEMVFEHRNYVPSMFFFLPIAAGFHKLMDVYRERSRSMHAVLVGFGILVMVGWGMGTYIRNMAWATEETLWRDAVAKAPRSYRAVHNLAWGYFERNGELQKAYELYQNSRNLQMHTKAHAALPLNNMANIHFVLGEHRKAATLWQEALSYAPDFPDYLYRHARALTELGRYDRAREHVERLIEIGQHQSDAKSLNGRLLLLQDRPLEALEILREVYRSNPWHPISSYRLGLALLSLGHYTQAEVLLRRACGLDPEHLNATIWLAKVNWLARDQEDFRRFLEKAGAEFALPQIKAVLENQNRGFILNDSDRYAANEAVARWLSTHYLSVNSPEKPPGADYSHTPAFVR